MKVGDLVSWRDKEDKIGIILDIQQPSVIFPVEVIAVYFGGEIEYVYPKILKVIKKCEL